MGGENNPVSLRRWWQNSQKKDKGLAENTGKEKQGFSADKENGLEGQEPVDYLVRGADEEENGFEGQELAD